MFKNNQKQYVNILRTDKQLKIDYKILEEQSIIKQETSTFLLDGLTISKDAEFKLETLQKNIPHTYLSTLYTDENQIVELTNDIDSLKYNSVTLNNEFSIISTKKDILQYSNFFKSTGLDYLISPFTILNEQINIKSNKNSLNIYIYESSLYVLILNENKEITKGFIKNITPFDNIHDSNFYTDDVVGQKLYEEVYFLELQQIITDIIQDYYTKEDDDIEVGFLEHIDIFYNVKQLSDDQLEMLYDTVMVEINYQPLLMEENFEKVIDKITVLDYTLIEPRVKKDNNKATFWIGLVAVSLLIVGAVLFYKLSEVSETTEEPKQLVEKPKKDLKKEESIVVTKVEKLPNHNYQNSKIIEQTMMFFDLIPYDAVLLELELRKNSSTFVSNFTLDSETSQDMQDELSKIYKESKVILQHKNKAIVSTIIANEGYKHKKDNSSKSANIEYQKHKFMSISKFTKFLKSIVLKNSDIKYVSKVQDDYLTYNYKVKSLIKTPKEFFDFISQLNKKAIPLNIVYPLEFAKVKDAIEVKFNLQFHQQNKKKSNNKEFETDK